jgi:hypothetical protein
MRALHSKRPREDLVVVVVVVVAATPNYLRQASQNLGKYVNNSFFLAKVVY